MGGGRAGLVPRRVGAALSHPEASGTAFTGSGFSLVSVVVTVRRPHSGTMSDGQEARQGGGASGPALSRSGLRPSGVHVPVLSCPALSARISPGHDRHPSRPGARAEGAAGRPSAPCSVPPSPFQTNLAGGQELGGQHPGAAEEGARRPAPLAVGVGAGEALRLARGCVESPPVSLLGT